MTRLRSPILSATLYQQLLTEADNSPRTEICGLLLGDGNEITEVLPVPNISATAEVAFELDPTALIAAHKEARAGGLAIIGHYHSHPNGRAEPSLHDAEAAPPDGSIWIIIAGGQITAWRAVQQGQLHDRFDLVPILPCS